MSPTAAVDQQSALEMLRRAIPPSLRPEPESAESHASALWRETAPADTAPSDRAPVDEPPSPALPRSLEDTGLSPALVVQLIMKILYFRGEVFGRELSAAVGLQFSLIEDLVETLKLQHLVQVKRSLGMGNVSAVFALTESGRSRAREYLEANQYTGPAPVPIAQYADLVRKQRWKDGWLTREALDAAYRGMVLSRQVLSQVGPAVSSGNSFLIYGKPGDGKTYLAEALANLDIAPIFVPYAIECQGMIIQLYDPIYHQRIEDDEVISAIALEPAYDARWFRCRRPFIVTGGELGLDMLDLSYNETSKI
jgi:predicted ATPase with chaperone activity